MCRPSNGSITIGSGIHGWIGCIPACLPMATCKLCTSYQPKTRLANDPKMHDPASRAVHYNKLSTLTLSKSPVLASVVTVQAETAILLQNLGRGMDTYFTATPLSQELSNTLAHTSQAHRQEVQHRTVPQPSNPFQEASHMLPPISATPSMTLVSRLYCEAPCSCCTCVIPALMA